MKQDNKLSGRQLTRMIYVEGFGAAGLTYPAAALWAGEGWISFAFYGLFLLLFTGFLLAMVKSRTDRMDDLPETASVRIPLWIVLLYLVRFFIHVLVLFCFFGLSMQSIYMPGSAMGWLLLPFGLLMFYCAQTSMQKHGRFLELLFPWVAFLFGLVILLALTGLITRHAGSFGSGSGRGDLLSGSLAVADAGMNMKKEMLSGYNLLLCSSSLEFIYLLAPYYCESLWEDKEKRWKTVRSCVVRGVLGGFLCNVLLCFVTIQTLGRELTASSLWPVIKVMQLVHLPGGFLERFDILLAVYWILCMVGVVSGYLFYGRKLLEDYMEYSLTISENVDFSSATKQERKRQMAAGLAAALVVIFLIASFLPDSGFFFRTFWFYKKWIDFPLILLAPFVLWIQQKKRGKRTRMARPIAVILLLLPVILAATGCGKHSDAEKRRYILSLYVDVSGDDYVYYLADARLSDMDEKEDLIPCSLKKVRAKNMEEMEEKLKRKQPGHFEWNHVFTIFTGPELSSKTDRLLEFLEDWDASWQKSPDVSVCLSPLPAEKLYFPKAKDNQKGEEDKEPAASAGQQIRELISQSPWQKEICRTPVEILKAYNNGAKWVAVYQAGIEDEDWELSRGKLFF